MQVKSIAECSKSILQYFRPSLSYHLSIRPLFCLFLSGHLRQVLLYLLLLSMNILLNPKLPLQDIANKWQEVRQLVPSRDGQLQNEMEKQQRNERLRRDFAAKANVVGKWIENQLDAVASITIQMRGSLEDQLGKLNQYEKTVQGYKAQMDELERINQVCIV